MTAENYPNRPIRYIVGFTPGTAADIVARLIAPAMSRQLGQPIIVDNRPGGNGTVGVDLVIKAPADGSMLLLGSESDFAVAPSVFNKLPYDPTRYLAPIAGVVRTTFGGPFTQLVSALLFTKIQSSGSIARLVTVAVTGIRKCSACASL